MALELDIWTADTVSRELGGGPDLCSITLRQAIDIYTDKKLRQIMEAAGMKVQEDQTVRSQFQRLPFARYTKTDAESMPLEKEAADRDTDYYANALKLALDERDRVLVLHSSDSAGSLGSLLARSIRKLGASAIEYGEPEMARTRGSEEESGKDEAGAILQMIIDEKVSCVAVTPTHMIRLTREAEKRGLAGAGARDGITLRSILLGGEFAPDKTIMMLEESWGAMVFEHYGRAETGSGTTMSCGYGRGGHVREADLYLELINPITGEPVTGESPRTPGFSNYGEIVVTVLSSRSRPLVRYRTNDFSRWILGECPCGSCLKRLDKVVPGEKND